MESPDDLSSAFDNKGARVRATRERQILRVGGTLGGVLGGVALLGTGLATFGDRLMLGADAREIAREEAGDIAAYIEGECRIGLKSALSDRSLTSDSDPMEAVVRLTLDANTSEEEDCVRGAVRSYQDSTIKLGDCTVAAAYPSGWTEKEGGMRMGITVDCLPHFLGENE